MRFLTWLPVGSEAGTRESALAYLTDKFGEVTVVSCRTENTRYGPAVNIAYRVPSHVKRG